jgi:acetylornithine deacetylase
MTTTNRHETTPLPDAIVQTIDLTRQLIARPSVSGDEAQILADIARWLMPVCDDVITKPGFTAGVIRANQQPVRRAVILCGHVDTVSPGDVSAWQHNPWQPWVADGRLYGLGASDMKAGVALHMTVTAKYAQQRRDDLDVWCVAVAHEEIDGAGSAAFAQYFSHAAQYDEASCIIAEPTDGRIEIGHRGNRFVELVFERVSGHASQESAYQASSLPAIMSFLYDLPTIQQELHTTYRHDILGEPTMTPTRIAPEGLYSNNKTAGASYLAVDIRTTPALDADFIHWIETLAQRYQFSWRSTADSVSSALCAPDAPILRQMQKLVPSAVPVVSRGGTDQTFYQAIGVNTVIYGPGDFDQAHTIDESISLKRIAQAYDVYWQLLTHLWV